MGIHTHGQTCQKEGVRRRIRLLPKDDRPPVFLWLPRGPLLMRKKTRVEDEKSERGAKREREREREREYV